MSSKQSIVLALSALALQVNAKADRLVQYPDVCPNGQQFPPAIGQVDKFGDLMGDRPIEYPGVVPKCHVCGVDCHKENRDRVEKPSIVEFRYGMIGRNDNNAQKDNCPSGKYPRFNSLVINGKTYEVDALDDATNIIRIGRVGSRVDMKYFDMNGEYQTCTVADTSCYQPIYVGNQYGPMTLVKSINRDYEETCDPWYEPECECEYCPCPPPPPLPPVPFAEIFTAELTPIGSSTAKGAVSIRVDRFGGVAGHGYATSLESDVSVFDGDCDATNGCGAYIYSGFGCEDATAQDDKFFSDNIENPWAFVNYGTTNDKGSSLYEFGLNIDRSDVEGRAFILHATDGSPVACGVLVKRHTSELVEA